MFLSSEITAILPKQFPATLFDDVPAEFRLRALAAGTLDADGVAERELPASWFGMAYRLITANDHATALCFISSRALTIWSTWSVWKSPNGPCALKSVNGD